MVVVMTMMMWALTLTLARQPLHRIHPVPVVLNQVRQAKAHQQVKNNHWKK